MKPGLPWQVSGVRREVRDTAREAARRAGMSVGEWLDSVILESAQPGEGEAPPHQRRARDRDPQAQERRHEHGRRSGDERDWPRDDSSERQDEFEERAGAEGAAYDDEPRHHHAPSPPLAAERAEWGHWSRPDRAPDVFEQAAPAATESPAMREALAGLNARIDLLGRQLDRVAHISAANAAPRREQEAPSQLLDVVSKLDRRLDQLIAEGRATKTEIQDRMSAVDRAVADLGREPRWETPLAGEGKATSPATPLDQALVEIAQRQRALDGYGTPAGASAKAKVANETESLPRPRTQELSGLEQQLRQVNQRIEGLKPCGIEQAVDTLRDDLAQIGVMLQDAMPRKSVEAIEREMRKLSERIEHSRDAGADATALGGVERGLAEVRDALRQLAPAENLAGVDRELHQLSQKIDTIAHNSQDPVALRQLEGAITSLRGIVSQAASNDALASLSDEVRALAGTVDRAARTSSDNVLNALEERISVLADALAARNQNGHSVPRELETVLKSLADKIERVQLSRGDQAALGQLEARIAKLVEKLDASDARLNHLESIERGLAELLIHLEHQRLPNLDRSGSPPSEVEDLTRDLNDLRQTEKRTQESLELVHGTLGHVVDRLATIETDIRAKRVPGARAPVPISRGPVGEGAHAHLYAPTETEGKPSGQGGAARPKAPPSEPAPKSSNASQPQPASAPAQAPHSRAQSQAERGPERTPIDPTLPPDQPLEPGVPRRVAAPGSAAERIAGSEAALAGTKPAAEPDAGGKANFIAAARRAAQAAALPAKGGAAGAKDIASAAGKLASRVGRLRALIGGSAGVLLVLGTLHVAKSLLTSPEQPEIAARPHASMLDNAARSGDPVALAPPAALTEFTPSTADEASFKPEGAPAKGRQSSAVSPDAVVAAIAPAAAVESARQASALPAVPVVAPSAPSVPSPAVVPAAEVTGSIPPPQKAAPALPASVPGAAPAPEGAASSAEKLPSAFGPGLRAAAAKGDAAAQYEIGVRFAEGRGVTQNLAEALAWFDRAAKQGLAPAQFRLGGLYEKGLGVKKNLDIARRLYAAAGVAGNAKALHNLAVLYAEGIDGKPDYETAARWFHKAADYGVVDSQYNLAVLYARGIGIDQNLIEAYKWFTLAARDGDGEAARKRDELGARLDPQSLASATAAVAAWKPQQPPEAAERVRTPPGGWDPGAVSAIVPLKRRPLKLGPTLDLATPHPAQ